MFKRLLVVGCAVSVLGGAGATVALAQDHNARAVGLVPLKDQHQAAAVAHRYGKRALWAFDVSQDRFVSTVHYSPPRGASLYATARNSRSIVSHVSLSDVRADAAPPASSSTPPPSSTSSATAPFGVSGSWSLKFDDEFGGTTLNNSKWNANWLGAPGAITPPVNSEELECYDPSQVTIGGGYLHLMISKDACQGHPYRSGMVESFGKFTYTYGYAEARIYLPGSNGQISNWPAFWTDGTGNWPSTGEDDIMEGLSGQAAYHFHSPSGGPGNSVNGNFVGWHTYGADWEPGRVTYYYDGRAVGTVTSGVTGDPMYLILNNALDTQNGGPIESPATMLVDYVRVWQHS